MINNNGIKGDSTVEFVVRVKMRIAKLQWPTPHGTMSDCGCSLDSTLFGELLHQPPNVQRSFRTVIRKRILECEAVMISRLTSLDVMHFNKPELVTGRTSYL